MASEITAGIFNDSYPPLMDGVANTVKNYAYWLNSLNIRTVVVTPDFPGYQDEDDFQVIRFTSIPLPRRKPYRLGISLANIKLMEQLNSIPFDIVHAHCPFVTGQVALDIGKKRGIPVIATFHSKFYEDFLQEVKFKTIAKMLLKPIIDFYNHCDFVWAVSGSTAETLKSYGFRKKIEIMENGVETYKSGNPDSDRNAVNEKYGFDDNDRILLFTGQHIWQKNVKLILQALAILKNKHFPFKMIFVGRGDAEPEMKKIARRLKFDEDVIFAGFIENRILLEQLYIRSDLFIFPSFYDNAPIVVREAAYAECPSVLLKGSNAAEIIEDGINGFITENSAESLAHVIMKAFSDPIKLQKVGKNAKLTISKPWKEVVTVVKQKYLEILKDWQKKQ